MKAALRVLPLVAALVATGCAAAAPFAPLDPLAPTVRDGVARQPLGPGAGKLAIRVAAPYQALADAATRRWVAADVFEVRMSLQLKIDATTFAPFNPPIDLVLAQKGAKVTQAVFSGLVGGQAYQVTVEAWGNAGGTAATARLDAQHPTKQVIDFDANDAEEVQAISLKPVLDDVPFNGTLGVGVTAPAAGILGPPPGTPKVTVELKP